MSSNGYIFQASTRSALQSYLPCHVKLISCNESGGIAQMAQRWQHGSNPLQLRQFGGISRASRRHKMSIRRFLPYFPPDNSAEVLRHMQKCSNNCIFCNKLSGSAEK